MTCLNCLKIVNSFDKYPDQAEGHFFPTTKFPLRPFVVRRLHFRPRTRHPFPAIRS